MNITAPVNERGLLRHVDCLPWAATDEQRVIVKMLCLALEAG